MKNIALTSAINYNDYLKIFKQHNYNHFDEIYIVTDTNQDNELDQICDDIKFKLIKTDKFYTFENQPAKFNRGAAYTYAMSLIKDPEIITIIDADTLLPESYYDIFAKLKSKNIFDQMISARRFVLETYQDYSKVFLQKDPNYKLEMRSPDWGWGYLQIFHAQSKWLKNGLVYPENYDCAVSDFMFRRQFGWHIFRQDTEEHYWDPEAQICLRQFPVYGLGPNNINSRGRRAPEFK
jgi:hypothetical protein